MIRLLALGVVIFVALTIFGPQLVIAAAIGADIGLWIGLRTAAKRDGARGTRIREEASRRYRKTLGLNGGLTVCEHGKTTGHVVGASYGRGLLGGEWCGPVPELPD